MAALVELLFDVLEGVLEALFSGSGKPVPLEELARELGGIVVADEVHARYDGAATRVAYTYRRDTKWTEIEVDVPASYPFTVRVCRHSRSLHAIAPVRSGDDRFDRAFSIDGAPHDVASRFFDEPLRRMLERARNAKLATHRDGDRSFVRLSVPGYEQTLAMVRFLVTSMARIPLRLRAAYAEADRAIAGEDDGDPYRRGQSSQPERDARAARIYEVERVLAMRARTLR